MLRLIALSSLSLATAPLLAQSIVVPNALANTGTGGGLNTIVRDSVAPRTYMMGINATELAGIPVGEFIVGLSFRQWTGATTAWPTTDCTWSDYEISIGNCIPTAGWSTTFASNFVGTPALARDGAMLLPAGTYTSGATPNAWGEFYFDLQTPFQYLGGDLGILFAHPGSSLTTNTFLETTASSAGTHGVAMSATTFQAVTGTLNASFYVTRIHYGYGLGCPGTGGRTPVLVQNRNVTGGGAIRLAVGNAPANAGALFVLGFGHSAVPLPNGCTLLTQPGATNFALLDGNGRGAQIVNIPPTITGSFNAQVLVLDAGGPLGFTASNAVEPRAF